MVILDRLKKMFTTNTEKKDHSFSVNSNSSFKSWYSFSGFSSFFYNRVNERQLINESYLSNDDVYSILNYLVNNTASIPLKLYEKRRNKWLEVEDINNDLLKLLNKPNPSQTQKEYRKEQYFNYLLTGDLFELKKASIGFTVPDYLHILPSQFVEVEKTNKKFFDSVTNYKFTYGGFIENYLPEQVIHLKNYDPTYPETCKGLSPFQSGYSSLSTSNQVHEAEKSMIENRGATGMISSNKEDYPLTEEEREEVDKNFKGRIGGAKNYNKMITVSSNVKFTQLGANVKDLMLTEIDLNKMRKFCNLFGLSSQLFNDPANKTFNNLAEAKKSFYTQAAIPLANIFVDNWNENLVPIFNEKDNKQYYIELDTSKIEELQKDKKQEAEKNKIVTESILSVATLVSTGQLERETAVNILIFVHGMEKQNAEMIIPKEATQTEQTTQENQNNETDE